MRSSCLGSRPRRSWRKITHSGVSSLPSGGHDFSSARQRDEVKSSSAAGKQRVEPEESVRLRPRAKRAVSTSLSSEGRLKMGIGRRLERPDCGRELSLWAKARLGEQGGRGRFAAATASISECAPLTSRWSESVTGGGNSRGRFARLKWSYVTITRRGARHFNGPYGQNGRGNRAFREWTSIFGRANRPEFPLQQEIGRFPRSLTIYIVHKPPGLTAPRALFLRSILG